MASSMVQIPSINGATHPHQQAPTQNGAGNPSPNASRPGSASSVLSLTHLNGTAPSRADSRPPVPIPGSKGGQPVETPENPRNRIWSDIPKTHHSPPEPLPTGPPGSKEQKFSDDYFKLRKVLLESDPDAVRRVVRDNFELCMLGSDYHLAFIFNVAFARASSDMMQRIISSFGQRILVECKHQLVNSMTPKDLDDVAVQIIRKANHAFLDMALVERLPTIEARRLVNALARAGRLGYDTDDIVVDEDERVIPTVPTNHQEYAAAAKPATPTPRQVAAPQQHDVPNWPPNFNDVPLHLKPQCTFCHRYFDRQAAWSHHARKRICLKPPAPPGPNGEVLTCAHCVQTFSGLPGLQYHLMNKVCGDFGPVSKESIQEMIQGTQQQGTQQPAGLNPPTKRPAPDSTPTHVSSATHSPPSSSLPAQTQTPQAMPPSTQSDILQNAPLGTPQAKDMSHLTAHQIESLLGELRRAEEGFKAKIEEAQKTEADPAELQKRLVSFKNSFACKQSTIRKKYGIKLRERRGRAAMDAERTRMGYGNLETPTSSEKHADKRARVNAAGDAATTQTQTQIQQGTPTKQVAVPDMSNGLNGSNATVALEDPTASMSQAPRPSPRKPAQTELTTSSTYQQGSDRVEVTAPSPSKTLQSSAPNGTPSSSVPKPPSSATMTAEELLRQMRGNSAASADSDSDSSTDDGDQGPAE